MKTTSTTPVKSETELYDSLSSLSIEKINFARRAASVVHFISRKHVAMATFTAFTVALLGGLDYSYDIFVGVSALVNCAVYVVVIPILYVKMMNEIVQEFHEESYNTIRACKRLVDERMPK